MSTPRDAFSAGANRAAGERAKRTRTPLLGQENPPGPTASPPPPEQEQPEPPKAAHAPHRPRPQPALGQPSTSADGVSRRRRKTDGVRLSVVPPPGEPGSGAARPAKPPRSAAAASAPKDLTRHRPHPVASPLPTAPGTSGTAYRPRPPVLRDEQPKVNEKALAAALDRQELTPKVEDLLAALIGALRTVAAASGKRPDEVEETVARTLSYLARRVTGQYTVDEFGFDKDWTEHVFLPGHAGPLPAVVPGRGPRSRAHPDRRVGARREQPLRARSRGTRSWCRSPSTTSTPTTATCACSAGDLVFRTPIIADLSRKQGSTLAANADAERLLCRGEVVGVFPEGYKGVGKPFSERYKLQRFGRGGFVCCRAPHRRARSSRVAVVGAEETYPIIANVPALARLLGSPYAPITPTWPWSRAARADPAAEQVDHRVR